MGGNSYIDLPYTHISINNHQNRNYNCCAVGFSSLKLCPVKSHVLLPSSCAKRSITSILANKYFANGLQIEDILILEKSNDLSFKVIEFDHLKKVRFNAFDPVILSEKTENN